MIKFRLFKKKNGGDDEESSLPQKEKLEMIQGIEELSRTTVKEVMVPRIDVAFISQDIKIEEFLSATNELGYSRYPLFKGTIDNVTGVVYVKDLLKHDPNSSTVSLKSIGRKPFFVPDSKKLDDLLREFKRRKIHIAVAIDEYGGVSGIVCLEDILEVIVGDIQDEFDDEKDDYTELGKGIYLCDARTPIDDLNDDFSLGLPDEDFETLGGFVFELFGKIPESLEKVSFETDRATLDFIVQDIEGHKINTIKIIVRNPT